MNTEKMYYTRHTEISLIAENLIKIVFIKDGELDLSEAKEMHNIALELSKGKPYVVLVLSSKFHTLVTKSARSYLANIKDRVAEAIVVESLPNRIMARFYLKLTRLNPSEIFKTEEDAIAWLKKITAI